ncbi:hypothetical protein KYB31_07815 [Clostridium felsineum]|uniref:hypothetical protein n=1 Tax=Clostridium felsineum TaxID=36839 RepID=UPI00214DA7BB|nr:hypothetical protein [Clostridium felsineum]MCR3758895.1 hypothetical protein [Clostridium felsineum]
MRKLKKKSGSAPLMVFVMFTFLLIYFLWSFIMTKYTIVSESEIIHDSLVSTNLAVFSIKNLDMNLLSEYPEKKITILKSPSDAYYTFEKHLRYNLGLNDNFEPNNKKFIKSKVNTTEFIIYNVSNNDITEYDLDTSNTTFNKTYYPDAVGKMKTPKGNVIKATTVYSKIDFDIETMFNNVKHVDVSEDTAIAIK